MLYILASSSGALLDWKPTLQELAPPPDNATVKGLASWDAPPALPYVWNADALDWTVPVAVVVGMSPLAFASRFSVEEQIALEMAQDTFPDATTRYALRVAARNLDRVDPQVGVFVDDERTMLGAGVCVDVLVALGLVTSQNRNARLAEILASPS